MKKSLYKLVFGLMVTAAIMACDNRSFIGIVECAECYQEKPDEYYLDVYLTFNDSITEIPLILYRGDIEDRDTVFADTARAGDGYPYLFGIDVRLERDYSMSAEYRFAGRTLYAVDGTRLKARLVTETCDVDCYVVDDNIMELEIKDEFLEK